MKFAGAKAYRTIRLRRSTEAPPAKAPTPSAPLAPQPWSHYFQFRKGSTFEVDGPLTYNGTGEVLERTADYLKFTMKMPAVSIFCQDIPAADMVLEATYKKEGKGNHVRATINGSAADDTDAEIISDGTKRTIRPKFTGLAGPAPEWITVQPDGDSEMDPFRHEDRRARGRLRSGSQSGSSGLALGLEPWSVSFPFAGSTAFTVNGRSASTDAAACWSAPRRFSSSRSTSAASIVGKRFPKLDLVLEATYVKEGAGNKVNLTVNGTKHADTNASITSNHGESRRTIVPSIVIPGTKVEMISFAPDGRDKIDFDVTIDGTEHDFDLDKVKGPEGQSWVRGFASSSTKADGLREVVAFAARTTPTRWKLSRADVAKRLRELVTDPDLVDQGALNLCGPAAFFHVYARRDPVAFVKYHGGPFREGQWLDRHSQGETQGRPRPE